jgi:hypothetical protein
VQVCAIIGGVFTVLSVMNSMLNVTLHKVMKKNAIGKLG